MPVWIIYSQVSVFVSALEAARRAQRAQLIGLPPSRGRSPPSSLLRQNKERAQGFVETLPIDEEVLRRAEIALAKKAEQDEALRRRREGGLYEPRQPTTPAV